MSGTSLVELTERLRRPGLLLRCLVTLVAVACATAVSVIVAEGLDASSLLLFVAAVVFVAWFLGPRWALAAALISLLGSLFFVIPPRYELGVEHGEDLARLILFAALALMVVALAWLRERADESRRMSEERLGLAMEVGGMGSWQWDIRTSKVTWSPELEKLHGLEPGTFGGTFESFLEDIHPDDREEVQRTIAHSLESGTHRIEYRIRRPYGAVRWVEGRGQLRRDAAGRPMMMAGICMYITARKRAEEALSASEERMRLASEAGSIGTC